MKQMLLLAPFLLAAPSVVHAAPGLDDEVYGATVEAGKTEIETRYGRLMGGAGDGEDAFVLEAAHGFSSRFYGAALGTFRREPNGSRRLETLGMEGILTLGHLNAFDLDSAVYVEVEHGLHSHDNLETKLLLEHRKGRFDSRLNLIGERALQSGAPVDFSYAASIDYEIVEDVSLGAEAFGDLGTSHKLTARNEHFVGPAIKVGVDHIGKGELELRAGFLFPVDRARDTAKGQLRVGVDYEF